jgi:hypothetical protein
VNGYKAPIPILDNPSVHKYTEDPIVPFEAIYIAENMAGPKAVCPLA